MESERAAAEAAGVSIAEVPARAASDTGEPLRLLIGYDGRTGSRDALSFARTLCEKTEVELTVASVRPYGPGSLGSEGLAMVIKEDEHWIGRGASKVLGSIPFSARAIAGGYGATGLKDLAEAEGSDMIVVGSTDRGRIGQVCPGSVGEGVLDGAPCAVAVAPRGLADTEISIQKIAVGYDGSRASAVALHRAIGLAERAGASLLVLGAVEISLGLAGIETRQPKEFEQARMEQHLRRALASIPSEVSTESRLLFGAADQVMVEAATEVDLLVLGSRGSYGVVRNLVLGSVGAAVMRSAPCPTLITPTDS